MRETKYFFIMSYVDCKIDLNLVINVAVWIDELTVSWFTAYHPSFIAILTMYVLSINVMQLF